MTIPIRVLVVEDSPTARALLVAILASDPEIKVIGEARTGAEAVTMTAALRPDLITMDVEMPVMNGLQATREIMTTVPTPIVIVSALASQREASLSLDATEAGALAVAVKPVAPLAPGFREQRDQLVATVKLMARVKVVRRWSRVSHTTPVEIRENGERFRVRIVAVAASTGGPAALHVLLGHLPGNFPVPVVLVQHIAKGFTSAFVAWLDGNSRMRVKLAMDREPMRGGVVYVAPEGIHCGVDERGRIELAPLPPIGGFIPSANHLFASVAKHYRSEGAAVILTGMGSDGVTGLRDVRAAGGAVLAQDEASSVVFGMPGEAIRAGVASAVLNPAAIAERLKSYVAGDAHALENTHR